MSKPQDESYSSKPLPPSSPAGSPGNSEPQSLFSETPRVYHPDPATISSGRPIFKRRMFSRVILPIAVLLAGIAFIAWAGQYLPSRGGRAIPATAITQEVKDAIRFDGPTNKDGSEVWPIVSTDASDTYLQYELGMRGQYDYPFTNVSASEVQLGVYEASCDCSSVQVCVFDTAQQKEQFVKSKSAPGLKWMDLEKDAAGRKSVTIPANASGALRISWTGKTDPGTRTLDTRVWSRATQGELRSFKKLVVLLRYVLPALFDVERLELGSLSPNEMATGAFYCWSATRDIQVVPLNNDERIKLETEPLDAKSREALHEQLYARGIHSRVQSAHRIKVTLLEQHEGKQLDLGLVSKPAPLRITSDGVLIDVPVPMILAYVRGEVAVTGPDPGGRIDLGIFSAKQGTTRKAFLTAPKEAKLTFVGCEPALLDLDVALKPVRVVGDKSHWELDVTARPNFAFGQLPTDGVIVLRLEPSSSATGAPSVIRQVRIPVLGTAGSH